MHIALLWIVRALGAFFVSGGAVKAFELAKLAVVVTLATLMLGMMKYGLNLLPSLFPALGSVDNPSTLLGAASSTLGFWNAWFPLNEELIFLTALSTLWVAGLAYRFLKSYVPTMS